MQHLVQDQCLGMILAIFLAANIEPGLNTVTDIGQVFEGLLEDMVGAFSQST